MPGIGMGYGVGLHRRRVAASGAVELYLVTDAGDQIITDAGDSLVTDATNVVLTIESGEYLVTDSGLWIVAA